MPVFSKLNDDTLGAIGVFLSPKNFLQLCFTSKEFYSETKKIKFLKLNKEYSLKYYKDKNSAKKFFLLLMNHQNNYL